MTMTPDIFIRPLVAQAIKALYGVEADEKMIQPQPTRKEFEGDITVVTFPLLRISHKSPEETASQIGNYLKENSSEIESFNVVKGFLNIKLSQKFWQEVFTAIFNAPDYGQLPSSGKTVIVDSSRGGVYSTSEGGQATEHQESYLKVIFGFFGITDVRFVRAEGLGMGDAAKTAALASARTDIASAVGKAANQDVAALAA